MINNRIFGRFKEGFGLGFDKVLSEEGKEIHHFKTFISNEMIFESQLDDFNLISKEYVTFWDEMQLRLKQTIFSCEIIINEYSKS